MNPTVDRPMKSYDLTDPASYANPTLDCDLIMKGGITSGMVYPLAACRLATRYRFRQVGGASAGGIAAALTAAAEYRRRHLGSTQGFTDLQHVPALLGDRLSTLFQPAAGLRRAFEAATTWTEPGWSTAAKARATIAKVIGGFPVPFAGVTLLALLPGLLVGWALRGFPAPPHDWGGILLSLLVWLPGALLVGLVAALVALVRDTLGKLPGNGYGMVRGHTDNPDGPLPLTDWLTERLDATAGLGPDGPPLTYGDLYGPEASTAFTALGLDDETRSASPEDAARFQPDIELRMMTTCLTLGRPYVFPFATKAFHWCPDCWRAYFPARVVDHLLAHSAEATPKTQTVDGAQVPIDQHCPHHRSVPVRRLPSVPDIPVVIGVRLSLSFPVLISGVPFYTVDFNRAEGRRSLIEVWFSDGGITSNFPIHFFDVLWPQRPTFGITLADLHPDHPERKTWRPRRNASGILPRATPIDSMVGYLLAVADTMQNWSDNAAVPAPGFRDRVVELRTAPGEGGLNLKMAPPTIAALSERGDEAAQELEDFDWDNHRWVRYRTAMSGLSRLMHSLDARAAAYREFVASREPGGSYELGSNARRAADLAATDELLETASHWRADGYPGTQGSVPHPRPEVRQVMRP